MRLVARPLTRLSSEEHLSVAVSTAFSSRPIHLFRLEHLTNMLSKGCVRAFPGAASRKTG